MPGLARSGTVDNEGTVRRWDTVSHNQIRGPVTFDNDERLRTIHITDSTGRSLPI